MTKRNYKKYERRERDFYETPPEAVEPLLRFLPAGTRFYEPCAGALALADALETHGHICAGASDIEPQEIGVRRLDLFEITEKPEDVTVFITNPPWSRDVMHRAIVHLSDMAPTWFLLDADWLHTKQAAPYLRRCVMVVSCARVSWTGDGVSGFENAAWYLFAKAERDYQIFYNKWSLKHEDLRRIELAE